MTTHKVTLVPLRETVEVNEDKDLFSQLKKMGYPITSTCGGCASCARCVVTILEGSNYLSEPSFEEKQLLGNVFHITGERLACQTYVKGDVTIDISTHLGTSEAVKPKTMRKTKVQVEETRAKRMEEREERKKQENAHAKDKEKEFGKMKKLGGSKRPKAFHYRNPSED